MAQIFVFGRVMNDLVPKESQSKQSYVCFDLMERTKNWTQFYQVWAWDADVTRLMQFKVKKGSMIWLAGSQRLVDVRMKDGKFFLAKRGDMVKIFNPANGKFVMRYAHGAGELRIRYNQIGLDYDAKRELAGSFPLSTASNAAIVGQLGAIGFYNLPLTYLEDFMKQSQALTVEQVKAALNKHLSADKMVIVTAGPTIAQKPLPPPTDKPAEQPLGVPEH